MSWGDTGAEDTPLMGLLSVGIDDGFGGGLVSRRRKKSSEFYMERVFFLLRIRFI